MYVSRRGVYKKNKITGGISKAPPQEFVASAKWSCRGKEKLTTLFIRAVHVLLPYLLKYSFKYLLFSVLGEL